MTFRTTHILGRKGIVKLHFTGTRKQGTEMHSPPGQLTFSGCYVSPELTSSPTPPPKERQETQRESRRDEAVDQFAYQI